jgi:2-oxoglutarate dehydrogenase E2 component (dihydrolipoamide succinyltransferase)
MEAVAKALKDFPGLNISVDGDYIKKENINLGMAASLPNGNLIVPNKKCRSIELGWDGKSRK